MNKQVGATLVGLFFSCLFAGKAYGQRDTVYFLNDDLRVRILTVPDFDTAAHPPENAATVKDAIYTENINKTHVLQYIDIRQVYTSGLVKDYSVTVQASGGYLDVVVVNSKKPSTHNIRLQQGERVALQRRNSDFFHDIRIQYLEHNPGYYLIMEGRAAIKQKEKMQAASRSK